MTNGVRVLVLALAWLVTPHADGSQSVESRETIYDNAIKVLDFVQLPYPAIARNARTQGAVVVKVTLDSSGRVLDASAISGPRLLVPAALENAKKWRFEPNRHRAVVIVYLFKISDGLCLGGDSLFWVVHNMANIMTCQVPLQP